jgi:hypothetical protein
MIADIFHSEAYLLVYAVDHPRADRVEFVVVTRRAARREPEPHRGHRLDAILGVNRFILGRNRSALARDGQATVEPRFRS